MSLISDLLAVSFEVTQSLRGEAVTLKDADGTVTLARADAVVSIEPATVGDPGEGSATQSGVIRLLIADRPAVLSSMTAVLRGATFYVVEVGKDLGGFFRCEISTNLNHAGGLQTNLIDLHGDQITFSE